MSGVSLSESAYGFYLECFLWEGGEYIASTLNHHSIHTVPVMPLVSCSLFIVYYTCMLILKLACTLTSRYEANVIHASKHTEVHASLAEFFGGGGGKLENLGGGGGKFPPRTPWHRFE